MRRTHRNARGPSFAEPRGYSAALPELVIERPSSPCGPCVDAAIVAEHVRVAYCEHTQSAALWDGRQWTVLSPICRAEYVALVTGARGSA